MFRGVQSEFGEARVSFGRRRRPKAKKVGRPRTRVPSTRLPSNGSSVSRSGVSILCIWSLMHSAAPSSPHEIEPSSIDDAPKKRRASSNEKKRPSRVDVSRADAREPTLDDEKQKLTLDVSSTIITNQHALLPFARHLIRRRGQTRPWGIRGCVRPARVAHENLARNVWESDVGRSAGSEREGPTRPLSFEKNEVEYSKVSTLDEQELRAGGVPPGVRGSTSRAVSLARFEVGRR